MSSPPFHETPPSCWRPGPVLWFTGLPASGKTTLAASVVRALRGRGIVHLWLDSDDLREVMTPEATYSERERDTFYGTLARLALRASQGGAFVVVSATSSRRAYRDAVRGSVCDFVEAWVHCDPTALRARDPKRLYAAAAAGAVTQLPGVHVAYEAPDAPELSLDSGSHSTEELTDTVMRWLDSRGLLDWAAARAD